jgi:acyl carrier protein
MADPPQLSPDQAGPVRPPEEIQQWILQRLARVLEVSPQEVDPDEPLARFGLDSVQLVLFVTDLEQWLGRTLQRNPLNEHASIRQLCEQLAAAPK